MNTIFLKDYAPYPFKIISTDLIFDIQSVFDVVVTNRMHIQRLSPGNLILDADELILKEIVLNHERLEHMDYKLTENSLEIFNCPDDFVLTIVTKINPEKNTQLMGLYASRGMLCTQCEAEGFRRITYFVDRPDVMTRFSTKIIANKQEFPFLLSNGNLIELGDFDEQRHFTIWSDPFLKPCYLFALVAGKLVKISDHFQTQSGKEVGLDIFVEPGDEAYCQFAMQAIKDAMRWDEQRFGREYDLERFMVVAVKDFNMGAMENKGLNIFNVKYVLADENTATDEDILGIESVIGHEYFHNWTGNRVTCRDWFQLSLKEGLTVYRDQEFSSDMNDRVTQRISDVSNLRRIQFPEDNGAMAHPVQPKAYQEISNFYTATVYEKGAELVRMYEAILGRDGFRKGMDLYFERHDGQAVCIEDFLQAMSDANHQDLSQFRLWYDQAGTPIVEVSERFENDQLHIHMKQYCHETADGSKKQALMIPIRFKVYHKDGKPMKGFPEVLNLTQDSQTFVFDCVQNDVLVNYLQGFSAPIVLKRDLSLEKMMALMAIEQDGFALWDLKQTFMIQWIQKAYQEKEMKPLPLEMVAIFHSWFEKDKFSMAFLAKLFELPSLPEIMAGLPEVCPIELFNMRELFAFEFAKSCESLFLNVFVEYSHVENRAVRAFRNVCLENLMLANPQVFSETCWTYYENAKNMTNRIAAFSAIMQTHDEAMKESVCDKFYRDWSSNELVMDKWFYLQATQQGQHVLEKVKKLTSHPLFSWSNPNKIRMLIGGFTQNTAAFHEDSGSGYEFLKECILKVDAINPQIAARLCTPLTRWKSYDKKRQKLMQNVLQNLVTHDLSRDVEEIVAKSIQAP
jgi:aminopeptidase N